MELLLNLAWLLLAIPAYRLWRNSTPVSRRHGSTSLQCLLALGCALVLLFPVISATDDLHAMRAEMEESPTSKRSIRAGGNERSPVPQTRLQNPPALLGEIAASMVMAGFGELSPEQISIIPAAAMPLSTGRAPPAHSVA